MRRNGRGRKRPLNSQNQHPLLFNLLCLINLAYANISAHHGTAFSTVGNSGLAENVPPNHQARLHEGLKL